MEKIYSETKTGLLIVITGASGAGKDTIKDEVIKHPDFIALGIKNIITCTDRPRRTDANPPEPKNAYHFVTKEELDRMEKEGLLAEPITDTGLSRKATPKFEIERLFSGEDLIWRIDPSRAADIASSTYFSRVFPNSAKILQENTLVICVNAPREVIESRRKSRDKEKYNPKDYEKRDLEEKPFLEILSEKSVVIENLDGEISETTLKVVDIIKNHHAKIKSKK